MPVEPDNVDGLQAAFDRDLKKAGRMPAPQSLGFACSGTGWALQSAARDLRPLAASNC